MSGSNLLTTKFHLPRLRPGQVNRPRLVKKMDSGYSSGCSMTLICAPAGYGKTTLAAGWAQDKPGIAWLTLNPEDSALPRFLTYLIRSLQTAAPGVGEDLLESLSLTPSLEEMATSLLNNLGEIQYPLILFLDDYHTIQNRDTHDMLNLLVEGAPQNFHLVITTREDPPLPLARLRARGRLTEIRARDLRFTGEETVSFFHQTSLLKLTDEMVATLNGRAEGWAVGLQLAGLAMQNQPDLQNFIENFRGSNRYIVDYLAEEVIRQQPEEIRRFLIQTSVLERLNAGICEAVTGRKESQQILDLLEQENLFLIALDDERHWYRYHHLFADYLKAGLDKSTQADAYKSAASWHEQQDSFFESVPYALSSEDYDFAAGVIERALQQGITWSGGEVGTLTDWLQRLPASILEARPLLSLQASRVFYLNGKFDQACRSIDQAENSIDQVNSLKQNEKTNLRAYCSLFRGGIAALRGEISIAIPETRIAINFLPPSDRLAHARANYSMALAYDLSGQTEMALETYKETSREALEAGVLFLAVNAASAAAMTELSMGKLRDARHTCEAAFDWTEGKNINPLGLVWSVLGSIALERNDLDTAERSLETGLHLSRQGGLQDDLLTGLVIQARLEYARGYLTQAFACLSQVERIVRGYQIPRVSGLSSAYLARLQLAAGQTEAALGWADAYLTQKASNSVEYLQEAEDLVLARVLIHKGDFATVLHILDALLINTKEGCRYRLYMEGCILSALAKEGSGNRVDAVKLLGNAIRLAASEGFTRVFLDEGTQIMALIPHVRPVAPRFVDEILQAGQQSLLVQNSLDDLPDSLTRQELRVLNGIIAGKSNMEIAADLVISQGTAKWHVHNILQKLGARDRPQAIARAREIGITN